MSTHPESPKSSQGNLNTTLYITNLDPKVREKDLAEFFSQYGETSVVKIVRNKTSGKSLSYGFVEFVDAINAFKARYQAQYKKIERREILIMFIAERRQLNPEAKVFLKNVPTSLSLQRIHDKFREISANLFVHINTDEKGKRLDFGFVHYKNKQDAELALSIFKDLEFDGQKIQLSPWVAKETRQVFQKEDRKNLYIRNLPLIKKKVIERSLTILLLPFGEIESMLVKKAPSFKVNYALVSFKTAESAQRALKEISERPTYLEGSIEPLFMSWYQRRTERENLKDHEFNAIFCENLKMSSTPGKLRTALERFGRIVKVNLCSGEDVKGKGMTRCGHVIFEFASSAEAAFHECKLSPEFQNLFINEAELELVQYTLNKKDLDAPKRRPSTIKNVNKEATPQGFSVNNDLSSTPQYPQEPFMPSYSPNMCYPCYPMGYYYPMVTPFGYPQMYDPNMYMMMGQGPQNMMNNNNNGWKEEANEKKKNKNKKKKSAPSSVGSLSTLDDCHGGDHEMPEFSVTEGNSTTEGSDSLEIDPRDLQEDAKSVPLMRWNQGKEGQGANKWKSTRKYGTRKPKVVELVANAE